VAQPIANPFRLCKEAFRFFSMLFRTAISGNLRRKPSYELFGHGRGTEKAIAALQADGFTHGEPDQTST
jgi:hypothetical protein